MTREEAIKRVDDRMCWGRGTFTKNHPPNIDECWEAGCMAIKALKSERKRGEWVPYLPEGLRYKCSECESKYDTPWHFCPNCGSYNGGEQSEND